MKVRKIMGKTLGTAVLLFILTGTAYAATPGQVNVFGEFNGTFSTDSPYGEVKLTSSAGDYSNIYSRLTSDVVCFYDSEAPEYSLMASYANWGIAIYKKDSNGDYNRFIDLTNSGLRMGRGAADQILLSYGNGTASNPGGLELGGRKITGLAAGENDTDAVNKGQMDAAITAEETRAKAAEQANANAIAAEETRAKAAEQTNANAIAAEETRAKAAEQANANAIAAEETRAKAAEQANANAIAAEETRAKAAEAGLQTNIDNEVTRAKAAEQANANAIAAEETRAKAAEQANANAIAAEVTRATAAEADLQTNIDNEVTRAKAAEQANANAIAAEETRAKAAEGVLQTNIDNEVSRATAAEGALQTNIDNEATRAKAAEQANADAIATEAVERQNADTNLQNQIDALGGDMTSKLSQTNDRVDRVGATAAALAGIHYQPMVKGQSQIAVGMGGYKGKKATALGVAYQISDRVSGQISGAANGSEQMFNVGFNYLFGQHTAKDVAQCAASPCSTSLKEAELQAQVDSLSNQVDSLNNQVDSLNNQIDSLNNMIAQLESMVKALAAK